VSSRNDGAASNTESSPVSLELRTAKRLGEINVLVFFPSWIGEFEVLDNMRFDDVSVRGGILPADRVIIYVENEYAITCLKADNGTNVNVKTCVHDERYRGTEY